MQSITRTIVGAALLGTLTACSGMGTTLSHVGRLSENKGYEIQAELPVVQAASMAVLKGRGYEVSVKADPTSGAERAGQIVIGQRIVKYSAPAGTTVLASASTQMDTRDLVDVYLSKKWRVSDNQAVLNITLVEIVGGSYLKKGPASEEVETPLTSEFIADLRNEIERKVETGRDKPAAK